MKLPIYLDYHATTPCDPRVVDAMLPCFRERFGNPSSRSHTFGREAEEMVERARGQVADLLGATPEEIVFTSCATEANNLALKGAACARRAAGDGDHIISARIEHKSVLEPLATLEEEGFRVTWLEVDGRGRVDPDDVARAVGDGTILVSIMSANNEIGTIEPIAEIAAIAHEAGAWMHTDAVQAVGKVPFDIEELDVDLAAISGHKFYGPKGIGALYVRRRARRMKLAPSLCGGGQERGLRSGTHNVPGIVGIGVACEVAGRERTAESARLAVLRDRLQEGLEREIEELVVNGDVDNRLPHNLSVSIPHVDGEALLLSLEDVAVSSGSACRSSAPGGSHVMKAIGRDDDLARSTIRFGLGRWTTEEEIDYAIGRVGETVARLRSMTSMA
ncbi:MAG TPA: cysteine desulfurase family protein [Gemmatimonadota bacterium]|jgi:cysteine desulfurase|nr:cysteine desulfurase family protein [Gemmatimonadota bacterium]